MISENHKVVVHIDEEIGIIKPELHGHFLEHLGSATYGGIWVGKDSPIPNINGFRKQAVEHLQELGISVLRWPGGCFADDYHWRDGIGPPAERPRRVNIWWGNCIEDNSFGTHEFMELCRLLGAQPYLAGNVGSGTPREFRDWMEYCNQRSGSTLSDQRRTNGASGPFRVKYWGVGNESWACGGHMTPEEYAAAYVRFATYLHAYDGLEPYLIAVGPESNTHAWTTRFLSALRERQFPLERNAAPASMDAYSVLHEQRRTVMFALDTTSIRKFWQAVQAVERLRSSTLLLVGETEPWVISSSRDHNTFASRLGLRIQQIDLKELYDIYHSIDSGEAHVLAQRWNGNADAVREPEGRDIDDACRVTIAFRHLLAKYNADGVAIACFTLLKDLGTTSCLAVSELNDTPEYVGICEGDLDAGATMLLMKALTSGAAWMGNPVVAKNDSLMLVHCTAPIHIHGERRPYILRNHHESGIGVSPAVQMPVGLPVTLCRIGRNATAMSVHVGEAVAIPDEPTCRTQLTIRLPSIERYLANSLGNHQVLSYGDYSVALRNVADILHLTLLN